MAPLAPGNPTPEEHEVMEEVMARGTVFVMGARAGAGGAWCRWSAAGRRARCSPTTIVSRAVV